VLQAWRQLQRIRRNDAALAELPVAALQALTANINRDSKKKPEPFQPSDFVMFGTRRDDESGALPPDVAAVALALRAEDKDSPILLTIWQQITASAKETATQPSTRALHNEDKSVWILCPTWEGRNIRGGLVCSKGITGPTLVRDVDRPLITHTVDVPRKPGAYAWAEAGLLLKTAGN
jgi:hypothetical protein